VSLDYLAVVFGQDLVDLLDPIISGKPEMRARQSDHVLGLLHRQA
jgi:hypothetical protein